jgi:putative membrane protein
MYTGFLPQIIIATIFYSGMGVFLMVTSLVLIDKLFKLDLHKELVEDQNVAFGVLFAGMSIAVSIIIAAAIIG